jgi:DNA-binding MarR family transcriptional regulator
MPSEKDRLRQLGALIHGCLSTFSRELRKTSSRSGLTPERLSVLTCIDAYGPIPVTTLANMECVRPATMSRMVTALVNDGMAARRENRNDGRGVLIVGTPRGKRAYQRATHEYHVRLGEALSASPKLLTLVRDLASALDNLESTS